MTTAGAPHLAASGLACAIGSRTILSGVALSIDDGEMAGVVGPNGSGKTTLLRTLAGVLAPVQGVVRVHGTDLHAIRPRMRARAVAYVGQDESLPADLLVHEAVALGLTPHRPPWAGGGKAEREAVTRALVSVELAHVMDRPVDQLSGGERRRVMLARGLAQSAPLLILDEPTNHLDVRHQLALLEMVRALRRTTVIALHDLNLAAQACDRIVVLHDGGVHREGPADEVLAPDVVGEVFGVVAVRVAHPSTGIPQLLLSSISAGTTRQGLSREVRS